MNESPLTVIKVGGALLGRPDDLAAVVAALVARRRKGERLAVVVSAAKGVTDDLQRTGLQALDPRSGGELARAFVSDLRRKHEDLLDGLADRDDVSLSLTRHLDGIERLLTGIRLTGELTDRSHDLLLAHGERLSAPLVAAALRAAGADARAVSSEEAGLVAVGPFREGSCDVAASRPGLQRLSHELHDRVLVLTGFYGVNADGDVLLFGRGGTDYSASVVAAGLSAHGLELWKAVDGFMSADPRWVSQARLVSELSFEEASELGYYGARILHPRCLQPLRGLPLAVSVRSVECPEGPGTRIVEEVTNDRHRVAALVHREGVAVVRVRSMGMVNRPGVVGGVLAAVGAAGIDVDTIVSSMTTLSFTVDESDVVLTRRTLRLLADEQGGLIEGSEIFAGSALLGVVGEGVAQDARIAATMLQGLARLGVPVQLISHGPMDVGLSCAVPRASLRVALEGLHRAFFEIEMNQPTSASR
ncbi:MAG: aspartate kinase [Pseudohongiellaceae bacterium]